ncbi:glycosyltransferase [Castellaniella sp.]|uniref:glycosyltransferase n=1 Tax=Castellaniella sp. TaxID=1955812 RepID=UPI0035672CD9
MKILHVSTYDRAGGAARAAWRLDRALAMTQHESAMRVVIKEGDDWRTMGPSGWVSTFFNGLRPRVGRLITRLQHRPDAVYQSYNVLPSGILSRRALGEVDVVNLHWVGGECLSIREIGAIHKPHVWTLHDMWAFGGAAHLAPDHEGVRWRVGYWQDNKPAGVRWPDLDRWVWARKKRAWRRPIPIVTPSQWLARCVRDSALMQGWPVHVIPNVLDVERFRPWPKTFARGILGLPPDSLLIMFGAIGGGRDPNKGWDLLETALIELGHRMPGVECVIFGQSEPAEPPQLGVPLHWLGPLHDDASLALAYSAADVMVVPSRQENLPQSGTEAQSCGCPVVAFDCTGLPDVVVHQETGYLAKPYDTGDLAQGIQWVLGDSARRARLGHAARERAVRRWAQGVVVPQYLAVYEEVFSHWNDVQGQNG